MESSDQSPSQKNALTVRMAKVGIVEKDLVEKFIRGTGSGGQKINKTSSCVFLQHPPTGIEVKVQRERSREMNRLLARQELCQQLENRFAAEKLARQQSREKKRRSKRPPSKRAKARNVAAKRKHGLKKQNRRKPGMD